MDFLTQVLGFAAFFALILKKVDQEEYGDPKIEGALRNPGSLFSLFTVLGKFCLLVH
jgi:hypothetical protein